VTKRECHGGDHAVQIENLFDFFEREAQFLIALNERHSIEIVLLVRAISRTVPRGCRKQSSALIKPNCLDVYGCLVCQFSDAHTDIVNPIPRYNASD